MAKSAKSLGIPGRIGLGLVGTLQFAFAFLAFWDLSHRDKREVRGPKPLWVPIIGVSWIGPLSYFAVGVRH